jgi:O-antigen ligase
LKTDNETIEFHHRIFFWYALFMAFPRILILGQNISIFIFPLMIYAFYKRYGYIFRLDRIEVLIIPYFAIGAILSVVNQHLTGADDLTLARAHAVLPNYIYWSILILFLIGQRDNIRLDVLGKGVFYGVAISIAYYFVLQNIGLTSLFIFSRLTQNAFAFIMIIYSPVAVYYITKKSSRWGVVFLFLLIISGFMSGSRSASILVMTESVFAFWLVYRQSLRYVILGVVIIGPFIAILNEVGVVEDTVMVLNPRAHNLLYNTENVIEQDRSYLVRRAMVEKGLNIYDEHPLFGIGLNNFTNYEVELQGNFEGSEYVINKGKINETSSHNSYINLLAEAGLFGIVPFLLFLIIVIVRVGFKFRNMPGQAQAVCVGFFGLLIHFYFINAIVNVFAWFAIGLCIAVANRKLT